MGKKYLILIFLHFESFYLDILKYFLCHHNYWYFSRINKNFDLVKIKNK